MNHVAEFVPTIYFKWVYHVPTCLNDNIDQVILIIKRMSRQKAVSLVESCRGVLQCYSLPGFCSPHESFSPSFLRQH